MIGVIAAVNYLACSHVLELVRIDDMVRVAEGRDTTEVLTVRLLFYWGLGGGCLPVIAWSSLGPGATKDGQYHGAL